jgi:C1A family cysteine protease
LPDQRDKIYKVPVRLNSLPEKVDLRPLCSAVEDQKDLGSCTANALAGALEYLERKNGNSEDFSRLFIYYNERSLIDTINYDSGAYLRDGIKTLVRNGACVEKLWPYDITQFAFTPPEYCYAEAMNHQVLVYERILSLHSLKSCLASGFPVVFGFTVYASFESEEVAKTGIMPVPADGERVSGGHAVCAVGYDDATQRVVVRNSWGEDWGMKGYFTMPYEIIENRNLSDDFWTIKRVE